MGRLSMNKISELLRQRFALKRSYRDISRSLNMSISTVSDYLARTRVAGVTWPLAEGLSEEELYQRLFLPVEPISERPLPDWEYVQKEVRKKGMTLLLLWREYRDQHESGVGYAQFCGLYRRHSKGKDPVMRQIHKAGEKTFVDYSGMKMEWIDPKHGDIFEAEIFVGCLGASQFIFAEATKSQQLPDWINSHCRMFEYFGGVSELLVPDNLKSGITKAHRYDPDVNTNYQHFSEHYGVAIVPARANEPKDKAKVESAVGIVERQILAPLRYRTFLSLGEINAAIHERLTILNNQPFQKMKTSRRELFETIDKPALKPLPASRYQYAQWKKAKVHVDYHVSIEDHCYSVPYKYIGKTIDIRLAFNMVECFYQNERIATHERNYKKYGFSTVREHMPKAHQEYANYSIEMVKESLKRIGPNAIAFAEHMMNSRPFKEQAYRGCFGLTRLGGRYGDDRLEKACAKAIAAGATRYQHVESILKNNLEEVPISSSEHVELPIHDNIRGANYYN